MNKFKFSISRPEERHVSFKAIIEREMVTLWLNNVYFGKIEENGVVELNPNILMKMGPAATMSCDSTIQPRRWPSLPSSGTSVLSMIGAHRNFSV